MSKPARKSTVELSIVICTRNREHLLQQAVRSIIRLRRDESTLPFELVVVDNNSTDNTPQVAREFQEKADFPFLYAFEPRSGVACARNTGVKSAKGEYVAFIDDDCTLHPDWLRNLTAAIRTYDCDIIQGKILLNTENVTIPAWLDEDELFIFGLYDLGDQVVEPQVMYGGNACVKRSVFETYGFFDERLGEGTSSGRGEDTEFFYRLKPADVNAKYIPDVIAYHRVHEERLTKNYMLERYYKSGYSFALFRYVPEKSVREILRVSKKFVRSSCKILLYALVRNEDKKHKHLRRTYSLRGEFRGMLDRKFRDHKKSPVLSICIITRNNESTLGKTLKSIESIADEIIVVDGGSEDGTREVAASHQNLRWFDHPWPGNFAAQKNFAMNRAAGDWILMLDADEAVGEHMRLKIGKLIRSRWHDCYIFPTYWLVQENPLLYVKSKKLYPDYHQRLFRNIPTFRYNERIRVHERFLDGIQGVGRKIKDIHIFHFDFIYNDREAREQKVRARTAIAPESEHISRTHYLYEDYPHKIRKCRERLW